MTDRIYYLAFRVPRLLKVLRDAGFTVEPPQAIVRFVAEPAEDRVHLEVATYGGWREIEPPPEPDAEVRPVETVTPTGQYL